MNRVRSIVIGVAVVAATAIGTGIGAGSSSDAGDSTTAPPATISTTTGGSVAAPVPPEGPPRPPWVRADGTIDVNLMPETIGAVAFDGQVLRDAEGKVVQLPYRALYVNGPVDQARLNAVAATLRTHQEADARRRGIPIPPEPTVVSGRLPLQP